MLPLQFSTTTASGLLYQLRSTAPIRVSTHIQTSGVGLLTKPTQRAAKKVKRPTKQPYSTGELNRLMDALFHPLAKNSPHFFILDGILHGFIEQNPLNTL